MGVGERYLGRVAHGIESLRKSVEINPNWGLAQFAQREHFYRGLRLAGVPEDRDG
jgi:hypothetical protein